MSADARRPAPSRSPLTGRAGLDLDACRRIHVVGIGGAGMSALASVLVSMGHHVTGSDLKASSAFERLEASGVSVHLGHDAALVEAAQLVAVSSAVRDDNVEVVAARRLAVPVTRRAELLAAITEHRRLLAVAGTHGKTTTTSMTALILVEAGMEPSFLIGGDVNEIGTNAVWEQGEWLVAEADESDGTFLALAPEIALVTNVEEDHLDHYGSIGALREAFDQFAGSAKHLVVGADDPVAAALAARHGGTSVGLDPAAGYRIEALRRAGTGMAFELSSDGSTVASFDLAVPGTHNVKNAAVAAVSAHRAGAPFAAAERALARFAGVARRLESRGEVNGVRFVDDYAHLPAEVAATIEAVTGAARRLVAVFQPHRFSRTAALGEQFGPAFAGADVVVVTDVYAAGEMPLPGVTGALVADAVRRALPDVAVHYVERRSDLAGSVGSLLEPGDLCLTLGAGDVTALQSELAELAGSVPW